MVIAKRMVFVALSMGAMVGCSVRVGDFTFASTKNLGGAGAPLKASAHGEDCVQSILGIPIGSLNPSIQEATDRAIHSVPGGDMLVNVSLHNNILYAVLYARNCMVVDGDVVNSREWKKVAASEPFVQPEAGAGTAAPVSASKKSKTPR